VSFVEYCAASYILQDLRLSWQWRRWRQQGPLKCWYPTATPHRVTNHKDLNLNELFSLDFIHDKFYEQLQTTATIFRYRIFNWHTQHYTMSNLA